MTILSLQELDNILIQAVLVGNYASPMSIRFVSHVPLLLYIGPVLNFCIYGGMQG